MAMVMVTIVMVVNSEKECQAIYLEPLCTLIILLIIEIANIV